MADYQKLYSLMFNAATDALEAMNRLDIGAAKEIIKSAQQKAEEQYLADEE